MANRLLIIEDNEESLSALISRFEKQQWKIKACSTIENAHSVIDDDFDPHVILADLGLPDGELLDHFEALSHKAEYSEWIFLLGEDSVDKSGRIEELAYDTVSKAQDQKRVDVLVKRALRASITTRRLDQYSNLDRERYHLDAYLGHSDVVSNTKELLAQLAEVPLSTLTIHGETGTGKGLVARIIHNCGLRKDGPIIELNCAALPKDLLESQLFGHEAGAFTGAKGRHKGLFEQADGGTLFLDEIGDMDLDLQAKLLKAIEDGIIRRLGSEKEIQVDVQIIAATGVHLESAVANAEFREDLYHRLSVFKIELPTLRQRPGDLVDLIPQMIAEFNIKANKKVSVIEDSAWEKLLAYEWPGNVRELRNVIERCVLLSKGETLPEKWLQLNQSLNEGEQNVSDGNEIRIPLDGSMSLNDMDKHIIQTALTLNENNVTETARVLGTTRETLRYRIQKYKLDC